MVPLRNSIIPDSHSTQPKLVLLGKSSGPSVAANLASKPDSREPVPRLDHSRASNCRSVDSNSGSLRWTTFGEALLNGSSDGMRSSQRCSYNFSCEEKYSRTSRLTFPFAAGDGFSAGGLALAESALPLVFSAALPFDFSGGAVLAADSGLEALTAP